VVRNHKSMVVVSAKESVALMLLCAHPPVKRALWLWELRWASCVVGGLC